jgi:hypothetical protein
VISNDDWDLFLLKAKEEKDATVVGVSPTNFQVSVVEKQDSEKGKVVRRLAFTQNNDVYEVSDRAKSNILKLSGFTGRLLKELTVPEIMSGLNHQLSKINSYGITRKEGILYALFDTSKFSHHPYDTLVPKDQKSVVSIHGNPLTSDTIEFQLLQREISSPQSGQLFVGMNAQVSSTSMVKARFGYGVYRMLCGNGWVDCVYGKDVLPSTSTDIIAGMVKMFEDGLDGFLERLEAFVVGSKGFQISGSEQLEELFTHLSVPPKIKQSLYGCINRSTDGGEGDNNTTLDLLLKSAAVDGIKSLWEVFQVLVWLANHAPTLRQSISMGRNIVRWADQILVSQE